MNTSVRDYSAFCEMLCESGNLRNEWYVVVQNSTQLFKSLQHLEGETIIESTPLTSPLSWRHAGWSGFRNEETKLRHIYLWPGQYELDVTIPKDTHVTLEGVCFDDGSMPFMRNKSAVTVVQADGCKLTFIDLSIYGTEHAVEINGGMLEAKGCRFAAQRGEAISIHTGQLSMQGCWLNEAIVGLRLYEGTNAELSGCVFSERLRQAIQLDPHSMLTMLGGVLENAPVPQIMADSATLTLTGVIRNEHEQAYRSSPQEPIVQLIHCHTTMSQCRWSGIEETLIEAQGGELIVEGGELLPEQGAAIRGQDSVLRLDRCAIKTAAHCRCIQVTNG